MPNGDRLNTLGKDIKERVDNWHKANATAVPSVSATFVGTSEIDANLGFVWAKIEEEEVTEREVEEMRLMESMVASTQRKIDATKQKINDQNKGPINAKTAVQTEKEQEKGSPAGKKEEPARAAAEPQFKYITLIENPKIV